MNISVDRVGHLKNAVTEQSATKKESTSVRVTHVGLGFTDVLAFRGNYPLAPPMPFALGYEFAGVDERGRRVAGLLPKLGATLDMMQIDRRRLVPIPDGLPSEVAAAIPLNYLTASAMIGVHAKLQSGDSLLIHGASGGVGTATLQLATRDGIIAFGTASPSKHDIVKKAGGTPIDYQSGDWLRKLHELRPQGVDAALDSFGGRVQRKSWRALSHSGTLVSFGFYPSARASMWSSVLGMVFLHSRRLVPTRRRALLCSLPALVARDTEWYRMTLTELLAAAMEGTIDPVIDSVVPAGNTSLALDRIERHVTRGKIVLTMT